MVQDRKKLRPGVVGGKPGMLPSPPKSAAWMPPSRCGTRVWIFSPCIWTRRLSAPIARRFDMQPERPITPSTLSIKDLPWQVLWDKDTCTLCGKCTAVCPVNAIELGVFRKRLLDPPIGFMEAPATATDLITASARKPIRPTPAWDAPCATWSAPMTPSARCAPTRPTSCAFIIDRGGQPRRRGGRRNVPGVLLDRIKFIRISMLTDPALDAGRHEFEMRTLLGRVLPPEENLKHIRENGMDSAGAGDLPPDHRRHVLRSPVAQHVGRAADGGGLSERGARHAGAHVHRRGRLSAAAAALAVSQIRHPSDRQRLLRLGRNPARASGNEGGPLRH